MASPNDLNSHVELLAESFRRLTGRDLVPPDAADPVAWLDAAPFVVVSHGTEDDPVLNYGNRAALALWEMDWETLTRTPSRFTAEPLAREERARLLERVNRDGFVDDYRGVRISASGRRFQIARATVWNLIDRAGVLRGQAATFDRGEYL